MMGMTGIQPQYITQDVKIDPISDEIRNNLNDVVNATQEALQDALLEAQEVLKDPNASLEQRDVVAQKIQRLTKGAQKATESVENYKQAELLEKQIIDVALNEENSPQEVAHQGQAFLDEAAAYYNNARDSLLEAGEAISPEMSKKDRKTQTSFWQKIANAALGIEVMIQRINSFPDRLADQIVEGAARRIDAVNNTFAKWAQQTKDTYTNLRDQVQGVAGNIVDHTVAAGSIVKANVQTIGHAAMDGVQAVDNFIEGKIIDPVMNFMTDKAIPALKSTSKSLSDSLSESVMRTTSDYQSVLHKRRAQRAGAADFKAEVSPSSLAMK